MRRNDKLLTIAILLQPSDTQQHAIPGVDSGSALLAQLNPYVRQCGVERRGQWHISARRLLDFLLVYIEDGHGLFVIDGIEYDAAPGDLFWIPPGVTHDIQGYPPSMLCPYVHFDLQYRPELSHWDFTIPGGMLDLSDFEALAHPSPPAPFDAICGQLRVPAPHRIGERLHRISAEATRATPYCQLWMSAAMIEVLCLILEGTSQEQNKLTSRFRIQLEEIARQMRNQCAAPWYIDDLATSAGLSPCYFRRLFKQYFGMSPHSYLVQARLSRAKDLMLHTSLDLSTIAERAGYSSPQSFSRAFQRQEGVPPSQFRRFGGNVTVYVEGRVACYSR